MGSSTITTAEQAADWVLGFGCGKFNLDCEHTLCANTRTVAAMLRSPPC